MPVSTVQRMKFDLAQIRDFWTKQANEHGTSHVASVRNRPVMKWKSARSLPISTPGDRVLDIGCANGFSTIELASRKSIHIHGWTTCPEMVQQAERRLADLDESLSRRIQFEVGDITNLDVPNASIRQDHRDPRRHQPGDMGQPGERSPRGNPDGAFGRFAAVVRGNSAGPREAERVSRRMGVFRPFPNRRSTGIWTRRRFGTHCQTKRTWWKSSTSPARTSLVPASSSRCWPGWLVRST